METIELRTCMQEKIKFKDMFGPAAEKPLQERYEAGELEGAVPHQHAHALLHMLLQALQKAPTDSNPTISR